jgi:hypothetical protein
LPGPPEGRLIVAAAPHTLQLAQPVAGLNHVLAYGQSLSTGWEGWPALSLCPRGDSLMLGRSVRPVSEHAPHFVPVGGAALHPLVATVQDVATGGLLTAEQVAGLPERSPALGETVLEAAVNAYRSDLLAARGGAAEPARMLASACGVGGRTLEALSRGARPELFNRLRDCAALAKQAAAGQRYQVLALLLLQGEHNAWGLDGGTADRVAYRAMLVRLCLDIAAELAKGIAGQHMPPALFTYQTGGAYASDELGVAMAQLDVALAFPGCFMVGPAYPVTDKGGHLDANGYRWLGAQFGKVMHRVLTLGEAWRPLHPHSAALDGRTVRVRFAVPEPPLAWGRPFAGHQRVEVADRGFTFIDADGVVPVQELALTGPDSLALVLTRKPRPPASLRYADRRHAGLGALHDSDATVAQDRYVFDPLTGHPASADVPELVGRPYPLMNWCVAFNIPFTPA